MSPSAIDDLPESLRVVGSVTAGWPRYAGFFVEPCRSYVVDLHTGLRLKGAFGDRKRFAPTWGYYGAGPHMLASAILVDYMKLGRAEPHGNLTHGFVLLIVSRLDLEKNWVLSGRQVADAIEEIMRLGIERISAQYRELAR
jgi:hypothetical protein